MFNNIFSKKSPYPTNILSSEWLWKRKKIDASTKIGKWRFFGVAFEKLRKMR
jgi:hypothetical protein